MVTANAGGFHRSLNILFAFLPHQRGRVPWSPAGAITVSPQAQALPTIFSEVILPSFT
jgi:hypothetical protein